MEITFEINSMEEMCDLMCDNVIPEEKHMTHELKIKTGYFEAVKSGLKNFEIRKNDRNFKVGDYVILKEWYHARFTGREVKRKITYIYFGSGTYGLSEEYCILGLEYCSRDVPDHVEFVAEGMAICPRCHAPIGEDEWDWKQNYCANCGQRLLWNDEGENKEGEE